MRNVPANFVTAAVSITWVFVLALFITHHHATKTVACCHGKVVHAVNGGKIFSPPCALSNVHNSLKSLKLRSIRTKNSHSKAHKTSSTGKITAVVHDVGGGGGGGKRIAKLANLHTSQMTTFGHLVLSPKLQ